MKYFCSNCNSNFSRDSLCRKCESCEKCCKESKCDKQLEEETIKTSRKLHFMCDECYFQYKSRYLSCECLYYAKCITCNIMKICSQANGCRATLKDHWYCEDCGYSSCERCFNPSCSSAIDYCLNCICNVCNRCVEDCDDLGCWEKCNMCNNIVNGTNCENKKCNKFICDDCKYDCDLCEKTVCNICRQEICEECDAIICNDCSYMKGICNFC